MEFLFSLENINNVVKEVWEIKKGDKVLAFYGSMGTGKTTFIHALCNFIGVSSNVTSPTFSIINQYEFPSGIIYHIDLYRLKNIQEIILTGIEDCLYSGDFCFVEWPEKAEQILPAETRKVFLQQIDSSTRLLTIEDK